MNSTIALAILGLYIPISIGMFFAFPSVKASMIVILGGTLFLPVGSYFKLPLFPELSKENLPYLCTLLGLLFSTGTRVVRLPKDKWILIVSVFLILGGVVTSLQNGDPYQCGKWGPMYPTMDIKDGIAFSLADFLTTCLPFYLGYVLIRGDKGIEQMCTAFVVGGLIYSLFALVEMRMSPQMHHWVYGYELGSFDQNYRWGGYRPFVFMPHGLALARYMQVAAQLMFLLAILRKSLFGIPMRVLTWYLAIILVFCRSTGAILFYGFSLIIFRLKHRRQLLISIFLAWVLLLYPLLRSTGYFPVKALLDAAGSINQERQGSLAFRFENEEMLLAHIQPRIVYGWGSYGRYRVCDDYGKDISVTDGYWIIIIGTGGLLSFLPIFGMATWPLIRVRRRLFASFPPENQRIIALLAVITIMQIVDFIPNGLWCSYPFFMAGALHRYIRDTTTAVRLSRAQETG